MAEPTWEPRTHYQSETVARSYDSQRFSSAAGRVFNALEKRAVLRAFAGLRQGAVILDAPCGTGRLAEPLLAHGFRVVGLDISSEMLAVAEERLAPFGDRFQTVKADIFDLSQLGLEYDAVLCARLLMHLPFEQQVASLRMMAGVAKGRVVFTQALSTPWLRVRRSVKRLLRHQQPVRHPLTRGQLQKLALLTELEITRSIAVAPLISEAHVIVGE